LERCKEGEFGNEIRKVEGLNLGLMWSIDITKVELEGIGCRSLDFVLGEGQVAVPLTYFYELSFAIKYGKVLD